MRSLFACTVAAVLLAGCASTPPEEPAPAVAPEEPPRPPAPVTQDTPSLPWTAVEGTYAWHLAGTSGGWAATSSDAIWYVSHTVIPSCLGDDGPFEGNLQLPPVFVPMFVPMLQVTLTWDDASYLHESLVLAYKAPGKDAWVESPYVVNGRSTAVDLEATEEERLPGEWKFAVCLARGNDSLIVASDYRPGAFQGELDIEIVVREAG